jgi:heme A synthase
MTQPGSQSAGAVPAGSTPLAEGRALLDADSVPRASPVAVAWASRLAFAGAAMTALLITVGGLVTNTDSGLACPDWPTCFGTPFPKLVGGVLMEHGHRYLATAVGFVAVLCVLLVARKRARLLSLAVSMPLILGGGSWAGIARHQTGQVPVAAGLLVLAGYLAGIWSAARSRGSSRLAQVALLLVITQGLLGGLTVMYQLPVTVLVLHTGTSMVFLSTLLWLALQLRHEATSPGADPTRQLDDSITVPADSITDRPDSITARANSTTGPHSASFAAALGHEGGAGLLVLATAAVYLQILLGATVRHTGAGLVCSDLPWCKGALWPLGVHPAVHLHMVHRTFALVAGGLAIAAGVRAARAAAKAGERLTHAVALALPALVLLQLGLGVLTIWSLKELWTVTGHLLCAALILSACVALWARARLGTGGRLPVAAPEPGTTRPAPAAHSPSGKAA